MLSKNLIKYLSLGMANLTTSYGLSGSKVVKEESAKEMLHWAFENNLWLDSAFDYPGSHELISDMNLNLKVETKIDLSRFDDASQLLEKIQAGKDNMKRSQLETIYVRVSKEPLTKKGIYLIDTLQNYLGKLNIKVLGFSVYEPQRVYELIERWGVNLKFQIPLSIANKSFEKIVRQLDNESTIFVARSVYLQGLLVLPTPKIPKKHAWILELRQWLSKVSHSSGFSEIDICLNYLKTFSNLNGVIVGANSLSQLQDSHKSLFGIDRFKIEYDDLPTIPNYLSDPRNW
jgi:aryl-alcohol dehydrogenase-like predicted oxidoreductase